MFDRIQGVMTENCALKKDRPIIVGVSGGADSLVLMHLMLKEFNIVVAHFNHLIRPEARQDALAVESFAANKGVPFTLGEESVFEFVEKQNLSVEEAGRELRYRFLFDQAKLFNAQAVAVAHNADDQVETVMMHLMRGSGLDGLSGMTYRLLPNPWNEKIPLVRPLLGIWRSEIVAYCNANHLSPLVDETNNDTKYFRNRVRKELIPELETYVPGFRHRLYQTADLLTADRQLLEELTAKVWQEMSAENGPGYVIIDQRLLNSHSLALCRRLIRRAVSELRPGARDIDFAMVRHALDFAKNPTVTGQADLGLGLCISLEGDQVIIAARDADLPTDHWPLITDQYSLSIPGELDLGASWVLRAEILRDVKTIKSEARENRDNYQAWVDLGEKAPTLNVRPRRPGDRFQPLGMGGKSMKISDFMINEKFPRRARVGWPLVCMGAEIVWVPGYRLGEPFRVTPATNQIVLLKLYSVE
jgi:tRNA(Ile)-lysidine synthase